MLENLALSHAQRCFLEQVESRLIQTVSDETLQTMTNPEVKYELQTGPVPDFTIAALSTSFWIEIRCFLTQVVDPTTLVERTRHM